MSSNPKAHTCHMAVRHCLPCAGSVGASDGANVVVAIASLLVDSDGVSDGVRDGDGDVSPVGARLELEAIDDGAADGTELGMPVGSAVGASEGVPVGDMLGAMVGGIDGAAVGRREVGSSEGEAEGSADGGALGALVDGDGVGENVGVLEGCDVGLRVGSAVGLHARQTTRKLSLDPFTRQSHAPRARMGGCYSSADRLGTRTAFTPTTMPSSTVYSPSDRKGYPTPHIAHMAHTSKSAEP